MNGEGTKRERKKRRELGGPMQVMWFAPLSFYSGRLLYIFSALLFIKQKQDILPRESSGKEEEKDGLTADSFQRFLLQFPDTVSTDSGCLLLGPSAPAALDNIGLDSCQPKSSLLVWQHSLFIIHKHTQVGIERAFVPLHNKRNMTRVKGFLFL